MSSEEQIQLLVSSEDIGMRIDKYLCDQLEDFSRSAVQHLIDQGNVLVGEKPVNKNYKMRQGEIVQINIQAPQVLDILPQDIPLTIVYEDAHLLVVNKPKGMVVHPAAGNYDGTLVNALLFHCRDSLSGINGIIRPGIVHRIDKNTSGLLVVAKNDIAHIGLADQIKVHSMHREYEAVVYGNVKQDEGTVDAPIGRHPMDRKKMAITHKNSKQAITHYKVIARYEGFTHISCRLETGRTHQIRVHMASIGHSVAGDDVYGPKKVISSLGGQCLHARLLGFIHPVTGENLCFTSELPEYFTTFLQTLKPLS